MLQQDPPPRMAPITDEEFTEQTRDFLGRWTGGFFQDADKHPVLRTFGHNPPLADVFSQFNIHLLTKNTMPVKQRQIAIMRVAWITRATYMWSSHLNTTVSCGVTTDIFEPVKLGADDPYFTPFESTVVRATEELVHDQQVSEANWRALMAEWSNDQMLDFLFTVGAYITVACVMKSTGVQRQPELLELAAKHGAP